MVATRTLYNACSTVMKCSAFLLLFFAGCKNTGGLEPTPRGPVWLTYTHATSPLMSDHTNAITVAQEGRAWIANDSGANTLNFGAAGAPIWGSFKDKLEYSTFSSGGTVTIQRVVKSISLGDDGSVWFGLNGGGVRRYKEGSTLAAWRSYTVPDVPAYSITSIASEAIRSHNTWVASLSGVTRYVVNTNPDEGTWEPVQASNLPSQQIGIAVKNPIDNSIWFGSRNNGGITYYDQDFGWQYLNIASPYNFNISAIAFDLGRNVWFGRPAGTGAAEGFSKFDRVNATITNFSSASTGGKLPSGGVNAIATDLGTTRWFGTNKGLVRLSDTTWTTFTRATASELPSDTITVLTMDLRGNLWIGTPRGIAVYNEGGIQY